jgi:hypothetical protein
VTSAPVLLWRRLLAEFLGSAFLAAVVIGSGIAAQRLSPTSSFPAAPGGRPTRPRITAPRRPRTGRPARPDLAEPTP